MRFNKRILLIFLVLVFASISCAAAADVADDVNQISNVDDVSIATTSDDSVDIDNNDINSISKDSDSSDDVVVEDGNNGADLRKSSTTSLYSNSAKSTTGTYNSNNNDFDTAYQNITQGKNATFKGKNVNITGSNSNYTIDASNNKVSITFNNCTGTVDNVHFKNFKLSAIRIVNGASITFTNCNFTNNSPRTDQADMGGGAVYITGINGNKHSTGIFNNCNFANNLANARASGGAICIYNGGNGTFTNCNFTNNSARGFVFGGAVAVFSRTDKVSYSIFKNCIFKDNKVNSSTLSTHIGGGIYYSTNASNFSSNEICIDNCTFDNNYAKTTGGAVYLHRGGNYSVAKDFAINEKEDIEKYNDKGINDIFKNSANVRTYASNDISTKFINNHDGVTDAYKANNQDKVHELVEQTHEDLGNSFNGADELDKQLEQKTDEELKAENDKRVEDALDQSTNADKVANEANNEASQAKDKVNELKDELNSAKTPEQIKEIEEKAKEAADAAIEAAKKAHDAAMDSEDAALKSQVALDSSNQNDADVKNNDETVKNTLDAYNKSNEAAQSAKEAKEEADKLIKEAEEKLESVQDTENQTPENNPGKPGESDTPSTNPNEEQKPAENNTPSTNPNEPNNSEVPPSNLPPAEEANPSTGVVIDDPTKEFATDNDTISGMAGNVLDSIPSSTEQSTPSQSSNTGNSIVDSFVNDVNGNNESSTNKKAHTVEELQQAEKVRDEMLSEVTAMQEQGKITKEQADELNKKIEILNQKINEAQAALLISVPVVDMYYHDGSTFDVLVTEGNNPAAGKEVNIVINGKSYVRTTDANGKASMNLNLAPGLYNVSVYLGSETDNVIKSGIIINSTVEGNNVSLFYRNGSRYEAKFLNSDGTPLANANVSFNIHGVFYNRVTDANGVAGLNINLVPGDYIITAINPINNQQYSNLVSVQSVIQSNDLTKHYGESTAYSAKIVDGNGNALANAKVLLNIHGKLYNKVSDANGMVSLNINLLPGNYVITAYTDVNGGTAAISNKVTVL